MAPDFVTKIIVLTIAAVVLLAFALFVLLMFVWPSWARHRALRARAKQDYLNARGTVHRQLLTHALEEMDKDLKSRSEALQMAKTRLVSLQSQRTQEIDKMFAEWAVSKHLRDVPGIGHNIQQDIMFKVLRGRLSDLHQAHVVYGVGPARQNAISQWVRNYEAMKPAILKEGLPGQEEINQRYDARIYTEQERVASLTSDLAGLREQEDRLRTALARLDGITMRDFMVALRDSDEQPDGLSTYLAGVYEEWEPMPEWFRAAVEV